MKYYLNQFLHFNKKNHFLLKDFQRFCSLFVNDKKVYIETYGCQMNFSDSEIAMSILKSAGYSHTNKLIEANVALLMTCAIREGAEEKIWSRLKYLSLMKIKSGAAFKIGVLGCMAERLKSKLLENKISPVHVVCGPDAYRDLPRLLEEVKAGRKGMNVALSLEETYADVSPVRLSSDGIPSAFVSIMRGCDNMCTYCIVPFTRGKERSRPITSIVKEIENLSEQGIKEVVLLGQNVNSYRDLTASTEIHNIHNNQSRLVDGFSTVYKPKLGGRRFVDLLAAVSRVNGEMRIRFTSPHPKDFPNEVIELIKETPNICNQLHIPAQSGSSSVLHKMGRGYTREAYLNLVGTVRSNIPNVAITSDFISGFCGETEDDHQLTLSLIRLVKYNFIFCFPYSMREKTKAYHRLEDDVSEEVKSRRHSELASEFRRIASELNQSLIGSIQLVLIDGSSKRSSEEWVGRNDGNTKVIFPKSPAFNGDSSNVDEDLKIGDYVAVKLTSSSSQSFRGEQLCRTSIRTFDSDVVKFLKSNNNQIKN